MSLLNSAVYLDDVPKSEWKNYIGHGYRNIYYTTDEHKNGRIILFGYDLEGNRKTFVCPWQSHIKYNVGYPTVELDIYGNNIATKYFNNSYNRKKYIDGANGLKIVEALKPEHEFLHYMFDDLILDDNFNKQELRVFSLDIETEISESFMSPTEAGNKINMITIHDTLTDKFYTWSLDNAAVDFKEKPLCDMSRDKFVFREFYGNEFRLLEDFTSWWENNCPDVVYGWNIRGFDIPYIVRRLENVLGKSYAEKLSPVKRYFIKEVNHDNARSNVAAEIEVRIEGVSQMDGLLLYRDKFKISPALDGGYSLDNVGEAEKLGNKIHYNGTLKDLYMNDYQKFYEYNVRDVDLCKRIDDKCKMIMLARQITSMGLNSLESIYSSISYLIGSLIAFAKSEMNGVVFNSYMAAKKQFDSSFEGAFVFPTIPSLVRGGIACIDFASLYPSTIRALNTSPETYVGKIIAYKLDPSGAETCNTINDDPIDIWDEDVLSKNNISRLEIKYADNHRKNISLEKLRELVKQKCIYTRNNTLFLKHEIKVGVVAAWCKHFYMQRKKNKKIALEAYHKLHGDVELSQEEKAKYNLQYEVYHIIEQGIKIALNSVYGIMGTGFSPIANVDIAQTITRSGKFCNISASEFIKKRFQELYGAPDDYVICVSGDTDSQFVNLQCMTDFLRKQKNLPDRLIDWNKGDKKMLWNTVKKFVEDEVNPYVRGLVHDYCMTNHQDVLTYELEYMSSSGIYETKKHYATYKMFDEGDPVDKIKWSGIELKKATVPKEMKKFLQEIYEGVIKNWWGEKEYNEYTSKLYDDFSHFTIEQVSLWKGYSSERQAAGFLQMQVGTTGIAKACTFYNQLIDKLKLGKKYDQIRVGDKVRFTYLESSNEYGIDCIAFKDGQYPTEFRQKFRVDYRKMFDKIILDPLKGFRTACKFADSDPSKQVYDDLFNL